MWPVSCQTPRCGHPTRRRCRRKNGRAKGDHQSCCAATTSINRFRSRSLLFAFLSGSGARSSGERVRLSGYRRASLARAFASRIEITRPEEWLLIEWPEGEDEPTKYWLSTLPEPITFGRLVDLTKLRWRIERDYQDLKQEVGLGHFEGRGWRGFHHHATLCIAAYGFLVSERETIPPSGSRSTRPFKKLAVSNGYRPRGSATATRTSHPELDCDDAAKTHRCHRPEPLTLSLLHSAIEASSFVTQ